MLVLFIKSWLSALDSRLCGFERNLDSMYSGPYYRLALFRLDFDGQ